MKKIIFSLAVLFLGTRIEAQITVLKSTVGSNHFYAQVRIPSDFKGTILSSRGMYQQGTDTRWTDALYGQAVWNGTDSYLADITFYVNSLQRYRWKFQIYNLEMPDTVFSFETKECMSVDASLPQMEIRGDSISCHITVLHDTSYAGSDFFVRFHILNMETKQQQVEVAENFATTSGVSTTEVKINAPKRTITEGVPYEITADVYNGCGNMISRQSILSPKSFVVFPNPTSGQVWINTNEGVHTAVLFSASGQLVQKCSFTGNIGTMFLQTIPSGVYLLQVDEKIQKIVKL